MDAGALLKRARSAAGISQRELADRSGLAASVVGDYERGRFSPTVRQLNRLLAAAGFQLQTELVRLGADTDSLIRQSLALPAGDRLQHLQTALDLFVPLLRGVPYAIEGAAAAVLQGAPIPAPWLGVVVPGEDAALERLARAPRPRASPARSPRSALCGSGTRAAGGCCLPSRRCSANSAR